MELSLRPIRLSVRGLFGHVNHDIELSATRANILAGPNGCGKTHTLRLFRAMLALDFNELLSLPFSSAELWLSDGSSLKMMRAFDYAVDVVNIERVDLLGITLGKTSASAEHFNPEATHELPLWLVPLNDDTWLDQRSGRHVSPLELRRRYGIRVPDRDARSELIEANGWLHDIAAVPEPIFIDTKRLDTPNTWRDDDAYRSSRSAAVRISQYTDRVRGQIGEAKERSLKASQTADEGFAFKLMTMAQETVNQGYIEKEYARLTELNSALSDNGLSGQSVEVKLRPRMNPTEKRVMNLFLQDWVQKLEPLLPIHAKLTVLRRIINEKFHNKRMDITSDGDLVFRHKDNIIPVAQLSSGEQHLIALFTQLMFSATPGSTVLIDEPEISLHAAWKHSFVSDIEDVAEISNLSIVIATHSTGVINGRWDIVTELGLESE